MTLFSMVLHAKNPQKNVARAYTLHVGLNLFGEVEVVTIYGRIGARGRSKTYPCASQEEAWERVKAILKRRLSAPKRIGVHYHVVDYSTDQKIEQFMPVFYLNARKEQEGMRI